MMFRRFGDTTSQQILGIGDEVGNLHILEIPRNLRRPISNELGVMSAFVDREVQRVKYASHRSTLRANEVPVSVKHDETDHLKVEEIADDPEAILAHVSGEESRIVFHTLDHTNACLFCYFNVWLLQDREDELLEVAYRKMEAEFLAKLSSSEEGTTSH